MNVQLGESANDRRVGCRAKKHALASSHALLLISSATPMAVTAMVASRSLLRFSRMSIMSATCGLGIRFSYFRRPRSVIKMKARPVGTEEIPHALHWVDIYVFATILLYGTLVLTLTIGCFIVMVVKGPAYVADAYPLPDAEFPDTQR